MKERDIFLATALESIARIEVYTEGYELATFMNDTRTQDAVIRNLEVIGQAIKDYGLEQLADKHPQIPWRAIAGMRNVLAHEYLGVDIVMVWDTVQLHLSAVEIALELTLARRPRSPGK